VISQYVFGGLLLAFLVLWLWKLAGLIRRERFSRIWPVPQAQIVDKPSFGVGFAVEFDLPGGRRVKSRMVLDADLRPVDIIMIAYDPADPARCVRVLSRRDLVRQLVTEILVVASAVAMFVWAHASR
jgi:hypothetical protein